MTLPMPTVTAIAITPNSATVRIGAMAARREVAFIDRSVDGWEILARGVAERATIVLLDGERDGLSQIAAWAAGLPKHDAVHVLCHATPGALRLGGLTLDRATLEDRADDLRDLGRVLAADGDILLYGCELAKGPAGAAWLDAFADLTGANVAASVSLTGASELGGDFTLAARIGAVSTRGFDIPAFRGVLNPVSGPGYVSLVGYTGENFFTIRFDRTLDAAHPPLANAFAVQVNGATQAVGAISVDGAAKTVAVTLSSVVFTAGDIIDVVYTDPTSGDDVNAIQGTVGNDAANFTNSAIVAGGRPAPSFVSAAVNGAALVLTYDAALDAAHGPSVGNFTVKVGGMTVTVSGVAVNATAKTVTLTLATPVTHGQIVNVAYTDPTGGNDVNAIQDSSGTDAATLPATSVTNNTPAETTPPAITSVSIPETAMKIGDTVTATITVTDDADTYTLQSGTIGGYTLGSLTKVDDTTYTATFTVTAGLDVAASADLPVSLVLKDAAGNLNTAYTTAISQSSDAIDATRPTLVSATVDGRSLVLTYGEALDAMHGPAAGAFTVMAGGSVVSVSGVAVDASAKTVTLTLASAVTPGQSVTVAYADPTGGDDAAATQDAAGNDATSLSASSVTNQTPVRVTGIAASPISSTVGIGTQIVLTLSTNLPVTVNTAGGTPTLNLGNGATAAYTGVDSSGKLKFTYTVAAGDTATSDLTVTGLALNGGSIGAGGGSLSFAAKIDLNIGSDCSSVALADLNGDGKLDIVTANTVGGSASVLLGNGDGTFKARTDLTTGADPSSVALADMDGDGKLDIVTANADVNSASVLRGNGDGTFKPRSDFTTGVSPRSVALADVDGDGNRDIVTANYFDGSASVLLGNGNGTFKAKIDFATGSSPASVTLADVNGDTKLDIVTANATGGSASVLLGNGNGTFKPKSDFTTGSGSLSVALADVDGDGNLDIVAANPKSVSASVLLGNGNGTFKPKTDVTTGGGSSSVALADLNGDGKRDIVTTNFNMGVAFVLLGNGNGTFKEKIDFTTGSGSRSVALADVDSDGNLDIVAANSGSGTVSVLLNTTAPGASLSTASAASATGTATGLAVDATRPTLVSATVNGTALVLTYSEALDAAHGPALNAFTVMAGGAPVSKSSVAVDAVAKTVTLTLASAVAHGQAVTIGYADMTGGNDASAIQDSAGNDAESLSATSVTNLTPAPDTTPPAITAVSIPDTAMKIGDVVTATITVASDADTYTLQSGTIAGYALGNLTKVDDTTYTATFTVTAGTDVAANANLPVSLILKDRAGNINTTYTTAISQSSDAIDATRPTLVSATVDGATLVLTYGEALDAAHGPAADAFTVKAGGAAVSVSSLAVDASAKTVTLTLASAITPGQSVTVAYADPTGGDDASAIQDAAGNDATSLATTNVANATQPRITAITASPSSGPLGVGAKLVLTLTTDMAVEVSSGSLLPYLTLGNGGQAIFTGKDSDGKLQFTYQVKAGDDTTNLKVSSLTPNGSSIGILSLAGFSDPQIFSAGKSPSAITTGDVNGDGKLDLVMTVQSENEVSVLLGNGDGTLQLPKTFETGSSPTAVAIADVNKDGKIDLVTANAYEGSVSVLLGNGDGTFEEHRKFFTGYNPGSVAVADLDKDGNLDIVTANGGGSTVSVLFGNGNGTFKNQQPLSTGSGPNSVKLADLDKDGNLDIVAANGGGSTVSVLFGNGNGTFQDQKSLSTGSGPNSVTIADLDRNGTLDIVTASQSTNTVSVLLGNGDGTFHDRKTFSTGGAPYSVSVADVNGDGTLDLTVANQSVNTVSVLLGNGNGTFQDQQPVPVFGSSLMALADLDGDGKSDLVTAAAGVFGMSIVSVQRNRWSTGTDLDASLSTATGTDTGIVIDTSAPKVTGVSAITADGRYKAGDTISLQVVFSEAVTVTGTPQLTLATGGTGRAVNYAGGSGTSSLTFDYTVQAGDTSVDLDVTGTTALALNGGTITDAAGNAAILDLAAPGGAGSLGQAKDIVLDTKAPSVPTITSAAVTRSAAPTLAGEAEAEATVIVNIGGATYTTLAGADGVWSLDLATATSLIDPPSLDLNGSNLVSVRARDAAGNISTAGTQTLVIDTTTPAKPGITSAALTSSATPTLTGTAEADATVTVTVGGATYATTATGGAWSLDLATAAPVAGTLTLDRNGANAVSATARDAAGNISTAGTQTLVIDTTIPAKPAITSAALASSATPTLTGTAEADATVTVTVGGATYTTTATGGAWSLDLATAAPVAGTLTLDRNGANAVSATARDAAGNISAAGTQTLVIDTTIPAKPGITSAALTSSATPTLTGTAEADATVTVTVGEATYATTATGGAWSLDLATAAPVAGTLTLDRNGANAVSATARDAAGNISTAGTQTLVIDTTIPAKPGITSAALASSATPTLTGTAEADAAVTVTVGEATYATTATGGTWSLDLATATPVAGTLGLDLNGANAISVTAKDAAGNVSTAGTQVLVIDTTAPTAPTITSPLLGNSAAPILTGTAEIGSTVAVTVGGATYTTTATDGAWSLALATATPVTGALGLDLNGVNLVSVTAKDAAGNVSATGTQSLVIDTTSPGLPAITSAALTNSATPTLTGTASAGSTVTVTVGGATYATTAVGGAWSLDLAAAAPVTGSLSLDLNGSNAISATAKDAAGNVSTAATQSLVIDTAAPAAPAIASAALTNDTAPTLAGTAEANAAVTVTVGGATYATTAVGGAWSLDLATATPATGTLGLDLNGSNLVSVTAKDLAGNVSAAGTQSLVIDTTAPGAPAITSAALTSRATPTLTGTADTGSTVTVTVGGATYATTATGGTWSLDLATATPATGSLGLDLNGSNAVSVIAKDTAGNVSTAGTQSLVIDTTAPSATIRFEAADIGASGQTAAAFLVTSLEAGDGFTWTITSTGGGQISGQGTTSAGTTRVGGLDLSGLADGTLTLTLGLTDPAGNAAAPVTAEARKATATNPDPVTPPGRQTIDGATVDTSITTAPDGSRIDTVTIAATDAGRIEDRGTANADLADVPVVRETLVDPQTGQPTSLATLTVSVPTGVGVVATGNTGRQTPAQALTGLTGLISAIQARTGADTTSQADLTGGGSGFLGALSSQAQLLVRTIDVRAPGIAPGQPVQMQVNGNTLGGTGTASTTPTTLVFDTTAVAGPVTIRLDNVEFAAVVGNATLMGGSGRQVVYGDTGQQYLYLGADDDILHGGGGNDTVASAGGNDTLYGDAGEDLVAGGEGDDWLRGGTGRDTVFGETGNDVVFGQDDDDFVGAGSGNDFASGGYGNDEVHGENGDDLLFGDEGNDGVYGGAGDDWAYGGTGNDVVLGGDGRDVVFGQDGDDLVRGEAGDDFVSGGYGRDLVEGGSGNDLVYGDDDDDVVLGGEGDDAVFGGTGNDLVSGEAGEDRVAGEQGNDTLLGGAGGDGLSGGEGDDLLFGGDGTDLLFGNSGNDTLEGGPGSDVFGFGRWDGSDVIRDFVVAGPEADVIVFNGGAVESFAALQGALTQVGSDTVIRYGAGDVLTLQNVQASSLSAANFTFA